MRLRGPGSEILIFSTLQLFFIHLEKTYTHQNISMINYEIHESNIYNEIDKPKSNQVLNLTSI